MIVRVCHTIDVDATITLGKQGRLVIPAEMRAALGWPPGERLHVRVDGPRIIIERPQDAVAQLRSLGKGVARGRSLVDELFADRRAETASE